MKSQKQTEQPGFATRAIHSGQEADQRTGAVNVPIYATSTYLQDDIATPREGYEYSRVTNPTRTALEQNLAALEGGKSAHAFGSGMAAISALITMMKTGDHVVCGHNMYGGTVRLFDTVASNWGITFDYVDTSNAENVARAITSKTKLVHIETPTNPLMAVTDIAAVAEICHAKNVDLSVDNTFMSPYFQSPLALGADIVMHSTTKFLNGHSDGLGGVLVCNKPEHAERFAYVQKCTGGILSPFECWLVLRGVKTLAVRMEQHEKNGNAVAKFLNGHKKVQHVFYPGLKDHPGHELAKKQQRGFGALIAFEMGSQANAATMLKKLRICTMGESLGGVETLVSHSATTTHASVPAETRKKIGITDGLVRISVGIEDIDDILGDLEQALA